VPDMEFSSNIFLEPASTFCLKTLTDCVAKIPTPS
jgi:hypothetical protein